MRRWIMGVAGAAIFWMSCSSDTPSGSPPVASDAGADVTAQRDAGPLEVSVYAHTDLPRRASTEALSGMYFDAQDNTLYALSDRVARVTPLVAGDMYRDFQPGVPLDLSGRSEPAWDGEGVTRVGNTLYVVAVETTARIERFDALTRAFLGEVPVPSRFTQQRPGNKGIESLASAPDGKTLFWANEQALTTDGPGPSRDAGTLVRIAQHQLADGQTREYAYATDPLGAGSGGDMGVSELAAISSSELLVLERGFQSNYGNTVRIYRVSLVDAVDVSPIAALDAAAPTLRKQLVVDLATLPSDGFTHPSVQPNPILDNYESLTLGPRLPDGRTLLFLVSDDNAQRSQVARVLALAVRGL
jgi:hypothetical protein